MLSKCISKCSWNPTLETIPGRRTSTIVLTFSFAYILDLEKSNCLVDRQYFFVGFVESAVILYHKQTVSLEADLDAAPAP